MLKPRIELSQKFGECNYITITDTTGDYSPTNLGGYGGLNMSASDVTAIDFVVTVNNVSYEVDKGLLPYGSVKISPLDLFKVVPNPGSCECLDCTSQPDCGCGDKAAVEVDCSTPASSPANFADGCIKIQVRVWKKCFSIEEKCTYTMSTQSGLLSVQSLYVERNGLMIKATANISGTTISFSAPNTSDKYGRWELRNSKNGVDQAGLFTKTGCGTFEVQGPSKPYSIQNHTFIATCNTKVRVRKLALRNMDTGNNMITDKYNFNSVLSLAIARLPLVEACGNNCKCSEDMLTIINRQLDKIDK